jgi:predicted NBD/HSP70 family sugar kinase
MQRLSGAAACSASGAMNLINAFNPQLVVVGGALSRAIEPFLPIVRSVVS